MIIVGVDPGSTTGIVAIDEELNIKRVSQIELVSGINNLVLQLLKWSQGQFVMIQQERSGHKEIFMAIEIPYVGKNRRTALHQAQAVGVIKAAAAGCGFPIIDVAPAQAKVALAGYGHAPKEHMIRVARMMYPEIEWDETWADALGIALAGLSLRLKNVLQDI